jgi:hypothetical protein
MVEERDLQHHLKGSEGIGALPVRQPPGGDITHLNPADDSQVNESTAITVPGALREPSLGRPAARDATERAGETKPTAAVATPWAFDDLDWVIQGHDQIGQKDSLWVEVAEVAA